MSRTVLALLTSTVLYGKERANITVYYVLEKCCRSNVHVVTNIKNDQRLKEALGDFIQHPIIVPSREHRRFRILKYAIEYVIANIQLLRIILRLNPEKILMCNEINFYDFYPSLLLSKKKIIFRMGDAPAYHSLSFRKYNEFVWRSLVINKVDRIICNSKYVQKTVLATGRNVNNDRVIYNYPPMRNKIRKGESDLYKFDEAIAASVTFGYIGQINEMKGVGHLVEAGIRLLSEDNNIRLIIAGSLTYDEQFCKEICNYIPSKYSNKIKFIGEIEDIDTFFEHIDVLCIPSIKQEPLANVLSEAKYHHCPSIIYPSGGLPELITHKRDGYICEAASVESLLGAMIYYIRNSNEINNQGEASYDSINKLGIDRCSFEQKWVEAYNDFYV